MFVLTWYVFLGVKILEYIYNATHPISTERKRSITIEEPTEQTLKRRKVDKKQKFVKISNSQVRRRESQQPVNNADSEIEILGDEIAGSENVDEMIFEPKRSKKIHSCCVPLHIVWHNFVSARPEVLENVLLYEPLQIEDVYMKIKSCGYKFHIQDLISFLDRKCVTIRINQSGRARRKN